MKKIQIGPDAAGQLHEYNLPTDPKEILASHYDQIRVAAAKMATIPTKLPGLRDKIAVAMEAVKNDAKEKALQELELIYYSMHAAAMPSQQYQLECLSWALASPLGISGVDEVAELALLLQSQGITEGQINEHTAFFLTEFGLI